MAYRSFTFYGFLHSIVCQAICFMKTVIEFLLKPFAEHPRYLMPALIAVASVPPVAVRSYWSRLQARSSERVTLPF